ncbi:MAG: M48 family metallopeptidase [Leptospiraceae bacterium]|nr:M48 family metallopeptidase [Leptospiraceae bacterium]
MKTRLLVLFGLLFCGAGLGYFLVTARRQSYPPTAAPIFELIGRPIKTVDRTLTRVLPIDNLDEKELGDAIRLRYAAYKDQHTSRGRYVQRLLEHISRNNRKGFTYTIYVLPQPYANAWAMPGGVLFITEGMLATIESEAELVSILGHEMGHVELSHCMDGVRFQLLARKTGSRSLGELADLAVGLLLRSSFSKNQESAADRYGFDLLVVENYDPAAAARVMQKLDDHQPVDETLDTKQILSEYLMSHPYTNMRVARLESMAARYQGQRAYVGALNYKRRITRQDREFPDDFNGID